MIVILKHIHAKFIYTSSSFKVNCKVSLLANIYLTRERENREEKRRRETDSPFIRLLFTGSGPFLAATWIHWIYVEMKNFITCTYDIYLKAIHLCLKNIYSLSLRETHLRFLRMSASFENRFNSNLVSFSIFKLCLWIVWFNLYLCLYV